MLPQYLKKEFLNTLMCFNSRICTPGILSRLFEHKFSFIIDKDDVEFFIHLFGSYEVRFGVIYSHLFIVGPLQTFRCPKPKL